MTFFIDGVFLTFGLHPPPLKYLNHLVQCKLCIKCVTWKSVIKDMHVRTWSWITCTSGSEMLDLNHWHIDILVDDFMIAENIDFEKCTLQQDVTSWYLHVAERSQMNVKICLKDVFVPFYSFAECFQMNVKICFTDVFVPFYSFLTWFQMNVKICFYGCFL